MDWYVLIKKQSWLAVFAVGFLASSGLDIPVVSAATTTAPAPTKVTWGAFQAVGAPHIPVALATIQGQPAFSLWYLQTLFEKCGWKADWDGHTFTIAKFPMNNHRLTVTVNGQSTAVPVMAVAGTSYINLSQVAEKLDGSLAYQPATKTLTLYHGVTAMRLTRRQTSSSTGGPSQRSGGTAAHNQSVSAVQAKPTGPILSARVSVAGHTLAALPIKVQGGQNWVTLVDVAKTFAQIGIQFANHGGTITVTGLPVQTNGMTVASPFSTKLVSGVAGIQLGSSWFIPVYALSGAGLRATSTSTGRNGGTLAIVSAASSATTGSSGTTAPATIQKQLEVSGELLTNNGQPTAGEATFADSLGNLHTVTADADGLFHTTVTANYLTNNSTSSSDGQPDLTLVGTETSAGWVTQYATFSAVNGQIPAMTIDAEANQLFTNLSGHLSTPAGAAPQVQEVSIRNRITQTHYYAPVDSQGNFSIEVPVGPYEVFALVTQKSAIYDLQPFIATPTATSITVAVPALPTGDALTTAHAVIKAGDSGVLPEDMVSVANVFEHVYPVDSATLGLSETSPITITLYSTRQAYKQHFLAEGYDDSTAQQVAEESGAVTEGPLSISIPMNSFGETDPLNTLAHELTHALVAIETAQLPSWANEGLAWHLGIAGQLDETPSDMLLQGAEWTEWSDIVQNQKDNSLVALGSAGPLSEAYNVEDQDYYAMDKLISEYGIKSVLTYVYQTSHDSNAFQDTFTVPFSTFSDTVTKSLNSVANQTDKGFAMTFKVLQNGPQDVYLQNNKGARIVISGLQPNQSYTITCLQNGQVTVPAGLTSAKANELPQVVEGDWYLGTGVAADGSLEQKPAPGVANELGAGYRQEFEVANDFGIPYLVRAIMYDASGDVLHAYPTLELPVGLQLVSLTPVS